MDVTNEMPANPSSRSTLERNTPVEHQEGPVARAIESQTARLPSDLFLWGAVGSIAASAIFMFRGRASVANFVGQWVPSLLLFGVYNKIVKVAGSDRIHQNQPIFGSEGQNLASGEAIH